MPHDDLLHCVFALEIYRGGASAKPLDSQNTGVQGTI
jgi:hypothetical protein